LADSPPDGLCWVWQHWAADLLTRFTQDPMYETCGGLVYEQLDLGETSGYFLVADRIAPFFSRSFDNFSVFKVCITIPSSFSPFQSWLSPLLARSHALPFLEVGASPWRMSLTPVRISTFFGFYLTLPLYFFFF